MFWGYLSNRVPNPDNHTQLAGGLLLGIPLAGAAAGVYLNEGERDEEALKGFGYGLAASLAFVFGWMGLHRATRLTIRTDVDD